jgi:ABC-type antimicrobial peptide transport system permease subunit
VGRRGADGDVERRGWRGGRVVAASCAAKGGTIAREIGPGEIILCWVSLVVGASVALSSALIGIVLGLAAGAARWLDSIVMRVMDGVMAIPGILLAITLVALWRASLWTVILAITFAEIPRVVRLMRSLVLSIHEEPYVEAAVSAGTPALKRLYRHILPNTVAPLIVQGTLHLRVCDVAGGDPELPRCRLWCRPGVLLRRRA